jgi:Protease inhibitor Inh
MSGIRQAKMLLGGNAKTMAALLALAALSACSGANLFGSQGEPPPAATPAPPPAPAPTPPPVDLAGRWQFSAASAGSCFMTFTNAANTPAQEENAPQGTIAPEGGCPGNFFMSRKWTFEHGALIMRDFKGRPLAQLSYSGERFEGQDATLGALSLSKQM